MRSQLIPIIGLLETACKWVDDGSVYYDTTKSVNDLLADHNCQFHKANTFIQK